jgi:cyclopropane-fatty-acyl-phospholipid synthase
MFEHMRNYELLLNKISGWLKPGGKLFIHIFTHKTLVYPFTEEGEGDWMGRNFFSGGIMPSHQLLLYFQNDLKIESTWRFSGTHYERTSLAWLNKMDSQKNEITEIFYKAYGKDQTPVWFQRWRIFFMACEVLFGYDNGREWGVSHYRFVKPEK